MLYAGDAGRSGIITQLSPFGRTQNTLLTPVVFGNQG
jgi:hypothetical protein